MNFNSLGFVIFLPVIFLLYWSISEKYRWFFILVASYYFYASWNIKYLILIIAETIISYVAGITIVKTENRLLKKTILYGALLLLLGMLFVFKYLNFTLKIFADVFSLFSIQLHSKTVQFLLPVGISFYTFQAISYVIDVYKKTVKPEYHLGIYAAFISFFPQLVAGPIERTGDLLPQIRMKRVFNYDQAIYGARQILWGFFKKIAVADVIAVYVDGVYGSLDISTGFDCLAAIFLFTIQIYCDFSGYADIAIGVARLFGIRLTQNFSSPYLACSVKDFWRRWHISLSKWFKDYVYIPLGGNRCSKARNAWNTIITFVLSGLWHGANVTFILWGMLHGGAQVVENLLIRTKKNENLATRFIHWASVFLFCNLAWVLFRADSIDDAIFVLHHAFGGIYNIKTFFHSVVSFGIIKWIYVLILIFFVFLYDCIALRRDPLKIIGGMEKVKRIIIEYAWIICIVIGVFESEGENPFVYFQF